MAKMTLDDSQKFRSPSLEKFADPLPVLPVAPALGTAEEVRDAKTYEITMLPKTWQFHRDLGVATTWGYWATNPHNPDKPVGIGYLGPTIEADGNNPIVVKYTNGLPVTHLLADAIDVTLWKNLPNVPPDPPGGRMPDSFPEFPPGNVWCTVHLHGGFTPPQFDGHPESWYTPDGMHGPRYTTMGEPGKNEAIYFYTNEQHATMLWYHDHGMPITGLNVVAGLAGVYIIRDEVEDELALPEGNFEVPLLIQDRTFKPDGSLFFPTTGVTAYHPRWVPEFFGDTAVVNGKAYPFLDVEPRRYRFRVLNGSNARFYNLSFDNGAGLVSFWLIGTDQGFLGDPVQMTNMLLAPAERADIILDFSKIPLGTTITVKNDAAAPFPRGEPDNMLPDIMRFNVRRRLTGPDETTPPDQLRLPPIERLTPTNGAPEREIVLREDTDPVTGNPIHVRLNQRWFFEPVEENPKVGTTEVWQFINLTSDAHPLHLHLVRFQVHNRQNLDVAGYAEAYLSWVAAGRPPASKPTLGRYLQGDPVPPATDEGGWKDTVKAYPGMITRVISTFNVPNLVTDASSGNGTGTHLPADYVYHCHMLEHEDNDMMRPYQVVQP